MITIISGTNRPHSNTLKLARFYQGALVERDISSRILSLCDLPKDFISEEMYGQRSPLFQPFQEMIDTTEKFIFVIPEYNGSFPGVLKSFVDACRYPDSFKGKKAALVGLSSGKYANIRGIEHFTGVCHYMRMHVMPLRIHIPQITKELDSEGQLHHADTLRFVMEQIDELINF
jgi:chromate reductase